jgi:hypothetical protein
MDSHKENELYERFSHLYRERLAPLESSKMGWGFQCGDGWYNIIHKMSKRIAALSSDDEFAPAITEVSRNEDGTLHVEARNLIPPVADLIETAREQSRVTCESCGYSPAFLRFKEGPMKGYVACGRCVRQAGGRTKQKAPKRKSKPRRAPDVMVVKR